MLPGRGAEQEHIAAAKAIKALNPAAVVVSYLNSIIQCVALPLPLPPRHASIVAMPQPSPTTAAVHRLRHTHTHTATPLVSHTRPGQPVPSPRIRWRVGVAVDGVRLIAYCRFRFIGLTWTFYSLSAAMRRAVVGWQVPLVQRLAGAGSEPQLVAPK